MRHLLLLMLVACAPKVNVNRPAFDEELGARQERATPVVVSEPVKQEAPAGKGLRTGTIDRAKLIAVLDSGPGNFLRHIEVSAKMEGNRFLGWQLVQLLDHDGPLVDVDVTPGDVLIAVNGKPVAQPDQVQTIWDSLRTADTVVADLWRGNQKLQIRFEIQPAIDGSAAVPAPK